MSIEDFQFYKKTVEKNPAEISLDDCDLSIRAYQFLKSLNINNLEELSNLTEEELLDKSKNHYSIKEIKALLQENNLSLKKDQE